MVYNTVSFSVTILLSSQNRIYIYSRTCFISRVLFYVFTFLIFLLTLYSAFNHRNSFGRVCTGFYSVLGRKRCVGSLGIQLISGLHFLILYLNYPLLHFYIKVVLFKKKVSCFLLTKKI